MRFTVGDVRLLGRAASLLCLLAGGRTHSSPAQQQVYAANPGAGAAALDELQRFLSRSGKAAYEKGRYTATFTTTLPHHAGCSATLREVQEHDGKEDRSEFRLQLGALSPDPSFNPFPNQDPVTVLFYATSGKDEIPYEHTGWFDTKEPQDRVNLVFTDSATADSGAALFRRAIEACGGQPQAPDVVVARRAKDDAEQRETDQLLGNTIAPGDRAAILASCQDGIRAQLRSPNSAHFQEDASVTPQEKGEGWLVMGEVEAQTAVGATRLTSYVCTVERFGKQFVTKNPLLLSR